jgi:hypothetical protein
MAELAEAVGLFIVGHMGQGQLIVGGVQHLIVADFQLGIGLSTAAGFLSFSLPFKVLCPLLRLLFRPLPLHLKRPHYEWQS